MSDIIIWINEYKLSVWKTNKAHELGFCKWKLAYKHAELPEYPETLRSSGRRYMTIDKALKEVVDAFYTEDGAHRFHCANCRNGTPHRVTSVDLDKDSDGIIVSLQCKCGTSRTIEYDCKVIGA